MRIDTCMFNGYLFYMGVGVGISFWCVLKLSEWNQSFVGISEIHSTFHQVATIIIHMSNMCPSKASFLEGIKWLKKPLRIHAKSLSDALAPSKKNFLWRWPPVALRGFCVYSWSAHCLQEFCQKGCRCSMANFIGIGTGALVEKDGQVEGLGGLVHVEQKRRRATPIWSRWKRNILKPQQARQTQSRRDDG